jgi:hypothetical protein
MTPHTPKARQPTARALSAELSELRERDAAASDDAALVAYEAKWRCKLRRLQRAFPERWRVAGLSDDEVRDLLTLSLIEALRNPKAGVWDLARPGKEWGLLVARQTLASLRKSFSLAATPSGFSEPPTRTYAPNQEEQWLEGEAERARALAQQRAEQALSRPQRQWLSAFKLSARAGGFFESSSEPNLSAASRVLGRNRSSAQRAYCELQARFGRELVSRVSDSLPKSATEKGRDTSADAKRTRGSGRKPRGNR